MELLAYTEGSSF